MEEMILSEKGIAMLIALEGEKLTAYQDVAGIWTIGVGHTGLVDGKPISRGMKITQAQSRGLLKADLRAFEHTVNHIIKVRLTQAQFDALVIFAFNIGQAAFANSSAVHRINLGEPVERVVERIAVWNKITVNGKKTVSKGLVNRRNAEIALYSRGEYVGIS